MLPQFTALQGLDHAGQRQRPEGLDRSPQGLEPVVDIPEGSGLVSSPVTRPVRADRWKDSLTAQFAEVFQERTWRFLCWTAMARP